MSAGLSRQEGRRCAPPHEALFGEGLVGAWPSGGATASSQRAVPGCVVSGGLRGVLAPLKAPVRGASLRTVSWETGIRGPRTGRRPPRRVSAHVGRGFGARSAEVHRGL